MGRIRQTTNSASRGNPVSRSDTKGTRTGWLTLSLNILVITIEHSQINPTDIPSRFAHLSLNAFSFWCKRAVNSERLSFHSAAQSGCIPDFFPEQTINPDRSFHSQSAQKITDQPNCVSSPAFPLSVSVSDIQRFSGSLVRETLAKRTGKNRAGYSVYLDQDHSVLSPA